MKLLSLNLWGGRQGKILFDYLAAESVTTDIFCFQEVFDSPAAFTDFKGVHPRLFQEFSGLLGNFEGFFGPSYGGWIDLEKVDFEVYEGQAIFVKKGLRVLESGSAYIYGDKNTEILENFENEPKTLQYLKLASNGKEFLVANAHGKWYPGEKSDTGDRLEQSKKILSALDKFNCPKILCGDFNLMPETQSVKMLETNLRNLIKDFKIGNTRNKISWEAFNNKQKFADYTFISPEIKVKTFEVPYNEVSDHLPMVLNFEV